MTQRREMQSFVPATDKLQNVTGGIARTGDGGGEITDLICINQNLPPPLISHN
jgi:hypothetical protein